MSDDAKKTILARRQRFIAAAIASVGVACEPNQPAEPRVCLSQIQQFPDAGDDEVPRVKDAGASIDEDAAPPETTPMVCLSVSVPPPPPDASAPPQPCLQPVPPPPPDASAPPQVCLSPIPTPTTPPRPSVCLSPPRRP